MRDDVYENGTIVKILSGRMKGKQAKIEEWNQFYEVYGVRLLDDSDDGYVSEEMVISENDLEIHESTRLNSMSGCIDITGSEYITEDVMSIGINNIQLAVYDNEGLIPHFHFYEKRSEDEYSGCICIMEPKYYLHGYHIDKLTESEMNAVIKFLKDKCLLENAKGLTNWEYIIDSWNRSNNAFKIQPNTFIPDFNFNMDRIIENKGNKYGTR